jgi:membrane-associated phospholipid phosphatase
LVKPAVGRTLGGVYSYPSGSTVGAAALATAAVLAAPPRWRTATVVVAAVFSLWMTAAVVSLHWHYPTDALAGLAYGVGVVLLADGSAGRITVLVGRGRRHRLRSAEEVGPEDRRQADG